MVDRERTCKACDGSGMQADDEGWQYQCSVCHGTGSADQGKHTAGQAKVMSTDENNRLLD